MRDIDWPYYFLAEASDAALNFLDQTEGPREEFKKAIESGELTVVDIVSAFRRTLIEHLPS